MSFFSDLRFIAIILLMIILLLLTIAAHFFIPQKLRIVKYILNSISILILIYFIVIIPLNWHYDKQDAKPMIGIYAINVDSSRYGNFNLHEFKSLTMKVNDDYTFIFSNPLPFFPKTVGKWYNTADGDMIIIKGTFDDKTIFDINGDGYSTWILDGTSLVNNKPGNKIVFTALH